MKNKKYRIAAYLIAVLPITVLALLYSALPEMVPTHWNIDGTVTYSAKSVLWLITLMGPLIAVLFEIMPKIDPKRSNYGRFAKYYDGFCVFMMVFFLIISGIIMSESLNPGRISISKVVVVLVSVLFLFLGNIMPKIKSNFYFGIKTPWTLSNDNVWNKTHRLGGRLMFIFGLVGILAPFILEEKPLFAFFMTGVAIAVLVPTVMSYIWFRKQERINPTEDS